MHTPRSPVDEIPGERGVCFSGAAQPCLFFSETQKCHFGALGMGSCRISARITLRWVKQQQTTSTAMTIQMTVPARTVHSSSTFFLFFSRQNLLHQRALFVQHAAAHVVVVQHAALPQGQEQRGLQRAAHAQLADVDVRIG